MKNPIHRILILSGIILFGCVENGDLCCNIPETNKLSGKWLLYEYGYSPGFEYINEPVPPSPAQTLTFGNDRISSTVEGLERFKYYRILNDTVVDTPYIALYADEPSGQTDIPSSDAPTYSFDLENNILTLYYRWCYEGCHMAFRKIE